MNDLLLMRELISEKTGIHFRDDHLFSLESSVKKRMAATGYGSLEQYLAQIIGNKCEMDTLIGLITVNETYFWREPFHFNALTETIFPEILRFKAPGAKVRFLSAGCSTGEEPYSIAMSLVEKYGPSILDSIEVFGVDIDSNVIDTARAGIYKEHSFRGINPQIREKYFTLKTVAGQEGYEISSLLKKVAEFHVLNLFDSRYPARLGSMDVIFYRNVSIYFSRDAQKAIFGNLSQLLVEGGHLFLSSAETYIHDIGILFLHEINNTFVYRKSVAAHAEKNCARAAILPENTPARTRQAMVENVKKTTGVAARSSASLQLETSQRNIGRKELHAMLDETLVLATSKEYPAALLALDSIIEKDGSFKKAHSLKASVLMNMQKIGLAEEAVKALLAIDEWDMEGLLLSGIIGMTKGLDGEAIRQFKKAIYINPLNWLAHYYLAEIYFRTYDLRGAGYEYGVAASILEKNEASGHGLVFFPLSFPTSQIARLCKRNADKIYRGLQQGSEPE